MNDSNPQQPDATQETVARQVPDPEQLRDEIAETREELGDTVEALAEKADVKARVQDKVDERKEAAHEKVEEGKRAVSENRAPVIAAGIGALLLLLFLIRRK